MKPRTLLIMLLLVSVLLSGCQQAEATQSVATTTQSGNKTTSTGKTNPGNTPSPANTPNPAAEARPNEEAPGGAAPGGMPDGEFPSGMPGLDTLNRLALGTFKLEGTENAVTAAQAANLLPLWQAIRDGSENGADSDAAVTQIQAQMTEAQLTAIEALGLTFEDLQTWLQEQGIEMQAPTDRQGGGQPPADGQSDIQPPVEGQPPAGGQGDQPPADGQPPADEQDDMQLPADGQGGPGGGPGGRRGGMFGGNLLLEPLITLLTARTAE